MSQSPFAHCPGVTPLVSPLDGEASEQWIPRGELTVQHMLLLHPPATPAAAAAAASPSPPSTLPEPWSPVPEVPAELVWLKDTSGLLSKEEGAKKERRERILGRAFLVYTHTHTHTHTEFCPRERNSRTVETRIVNAGLLFSPSRALPRKVILCG